MTKTHRRVGIVLTRSTYLLISLNILTVSLPFQSLHSDTDTLCMSHENPSWHLLMVSYTAQRKCIHIAAALILPCMSNVNSSLVQTDFAQNAFFFTEVTLLMYPLEVEQLRDTKRKC